MVDSMQPIVNIRLSCLPLDQHMKANKSKAGAANKSKAGAINNLSLSREGYTRAGLILSASYFLGTRSTAAVHHLSLN